MLTTHEEKGFKKRERRVKPVASERRECKAVRKTIHAKPERANQIIAVAIGEDVTTVRNYFDLNLATRTVSEKIYSYCCYHKRRDDSDIETPVKLGRK